MDTATVSLQLPSDLFTQLQKLAVMEQISPVEVIARLLANRSAQFTSSKSDPVFELLGAYQSKAPLIDDIPVSEDTDLYLLAEAMGEDASTLSAWELMPARYVEGADGRPLRRDSVTQ